MHGVPIPAGVTTRVRASTALLVVLALLAVVASGCAGGGGTTAAAPTSLEALADSARRSADASTGRFTFAMDMSMPGFGGAFGFTGEGAFDTKVGKTQMSIDLSSFFELMKGLASSFGGSTSGSLGDVDADDFKIDAIVDGLVMYMHMPFLEDKIPGGKPWVKIDLRKAAASVPGFDVDELLQFTNNGPQSTLSYLEAVSGSIETVGVEDVRGTSTTHYRVSIDLTKYANLVPSAQREKLASLLDQLVKQTGVRTIPVDVWVDADSLVRKLEMDFSMTQPGSSQTATASMTFEMFDYGEPVNITLPLPEETADVTSLAGS
jgi:hypothetical protein